MPQVFLITGSTGIAAATAQLAASRGTRVFLTSRREDRLRALADRIGGGYCPADLTVPGSAEKAVRACVRRYGRIDGLFNVAGISGRRFGDGPVHECTDAGWETTIRSNLTSMFRMCRAAIAQMLRQPAGRTGLRGSVLNMASVLAFSPEPKHFATHAYAASKGAIIGLSRAMAATYAPRGIRVNAIAPALVETPMSERAQSDARILRFMKTKQPLLGRLIDADEVARAAFFLLGDEAAAITGDVLTVDAGWSVSG